jgi:hypothetical protein
MQRKPEIRKHPQQMCGTFGKLPMTSAQASDLMDRLICQSSQMSDASLEPEPLVRVVKLQESVFRK